jgi:hypothetical protein
VLEMEYWLDVLLCGGVVAAKFFLAIIIALVIQGIVYRITGFSIYNYAKKKLITDQLEK